MSFCAPITREFARDSRGNVAILFGFALVPILLAVGMAVDYGRALTVKERMADAADSSALAIGSWTGLTQTELKTKAQQYFDANYPPSAFGTVGKLNVVFVNDDIQVTVSGKVNTTFMKLANITTLDIAAGATITKRERNIELALVLDTTGSMSSSGKLSALKIAAKQMVSQLFDGKSTSDTLKIAVVPFAAAVNIGSDKLNSGWLDKTAQTTIAYEDFKSGVKVLDFYSGGANALSNRSWAGCVRERGGSYELTDDAPSSGATLWVPYFAPDEPDSSSSFYNNYLSDGSYSSATCYNGTTDDAKRQCYTGKYKGKSVSSTSVGPDFNCPPTKITALTNAKGTIDAAIDALAAKGSTVIPAGLLWGWRVLSPGAPFTEGKPYSDEKWVKAMVLLTDGENDVGGGGNGFNKSSYNAFGFARNGHLGSTAGTSAESTLNTKTATVCNSIKAQGIQVYTIGFQVTSSTVTTLLKNCATKPDMYYNSPSNDQLASIFQDIAQGLDELRIAQ